MNYACIYIYTVLPPGATKVDQTHKFDDFLDFSDFFSDLIGQCYDQNKSCQKLLYKQL